MIKEIMNIIGLIGPKSVTLLIILIPAYELKYKFVLVLIWFLKLVVDYDAARPGHGGNVYKLTKGFEFEVGELIVACIQFVPALIFLLAVILMKTWIPAIPGVLAALMYFASIIWCIKDVIVEKKRRKERKVNTDCKK